MAAGKKKLTHKQLKDAAKKKELSDQQLLRELQKAMDDAAPPSLVSKAKQAFRRRGSSR